MKRLKTENTVAVFRTFKDHGDVIALFPFEAHNGTLIMSYQRIGQHGAADYSHVVDVPRPSTHDELEPLKRELERIGYDLRILKRRNRK